VRCRQIPRSRRNTLSNNPVPVPKKSPWQNGADESFNGKLRDEFLTLQWFRNRVDAKVGTEFKATCAAHLGEERSPAMPVRADQEEHETKTGV
jgi:hypothetical protein